MSQWTIRKKNPNKANLKPHISNTALVNSKAEIRGKVFICESATIGKSKISAGNDQNIHIGKDATIKDNVLICAEVVNPPDTDKKSKQVRDIFIGNNVFISSGSYIYGPTIISDRVYIGQKTKIINSKIGEGCIIEDNVLIKNSVIPPDTYIRADSNIDSIENYKLSRKIQLIS